MTILGTTGDDNLTGTAGDDLFDLRQGGHDTASGLGGDDKFIMRGSLSTGDHLDGGDGTDTVVIDGAYNQGVTISNGMFTNIENLIIKGDHPYTNVNLTGAVAAGTSLTINTTDLPGILSALEFQAFATTPVAGSYHFVLGTGTNQIVMGDQFKVTDHISDPTGNTNLVLDGNYTMRFSARTIVDVENLGMDHAHNYHFTENDGNVTAGFNMLVSGAADATHTDYFNGAAETDGSFSFFSDKGAATYQGGAGDDSFSGGLIASDRFYGNSGDDYVNWDSGMKSATSLHTQLHGVEKIILAFAQNGSTQTIVTGGHIADAGKDFTVDATNYHAGTVTVDVDDSADHSGGLHFINGENTAIVIGTAHGDDFDFTLGGDGTLTGGGGADTIEANSANTYTFIYTAVEDSTGTQHDTISGVNLAHNTFQTQVQVIGVDAAVTTGTLSTGSFDADLAAAIGSGQMAVHHAVLFTANAGTLSGHTFLVVDQNGEAGYQTHEDLVVDVTGATGTLTLANFGWM